MSVKKAFMLVKINIEKSAIFSLMKTRKVVLGGLKIMLCLGTHTVLMGP